MTTTIQALTAIIWLTLGLAAGCIIIILFETACSIVENRLNKRSTKRFNEIILLAHRIWEQEGRPNGQDGEHWAKAKAIWNESQKKS